MAMYVLMPGVFNSGQGNEQQYQRSQAEKGSDIEEGKVKVHLVQRPANQGRGGRQDEPGEGQHSQGSSSHTGSHYVQGSGGEDKLVAEKERAQQGQNDNQDDVVLGEGHQQQGQRAQEQHPWNQDQLPVETVGQVAHQRGEPNPYQDQQGNVETPGLHAQVQLIRQVQRQEGKETDVGHAA